MSAYDLLSGDGGDGGGGDGGGGDGATGDLPEDMSGVLCRCTGYRGILAAITDVAEAYPDGLPGPLGCAAPGAR